MSHLLVHGHVSLPLSDYSLNDVQACAKNDFKIGAALEEVYVSLGVSMSKCRGILNEIKGEWKGMFLPCL